MNKLATPLVLLVVCTSLMSCSQSPVEDVELDDVVTPVFEFSTCLTQGSDLSLPCSDTTSVDFGTMPYGGSAFSAVRVSNTGNQPGTVSVSIDGETSWVSATMFRQHPEGAGLQPVAAPFELVPSYSAIVMLSVTDIEQPGTLPQATLILTIKASGQTAETIEYELKGTVDQCADGYQDCNGNTVDGCEVDTRTDLEHCGGCGARCSTQNGTAACVDGKCTQVCDVGFTGEDCADCIEGRVGSACTPCPANEDGVICSGNGDCSASSEGAAFCTCNTGYQADDCSQDVNECDADISPCHENATCTNVDGSFTCECDPGFEGNGTTCANIDECTFLPCVNGTCTDGVVGYTCACEPGWFGQNCDQDIDECAPNPCVNGTCENQLADYLCICAPGWSGKDCHINSDDCEPNPCQNGTCSDAIADYNCACENGWGGKNCEQNLDDCLANPCVNGTCVDQVADYSCNCEAGWAGKNCDQNTDDCASLPCQNGVCTDLVNGYACACEAGWAGKNCDQDIDECASQPCINGTCSHQLADYSCACDAGWSGKNCDQDIDECASNPCVNGQCTDKVDDYSCACDAGWSGKNCNVNVDECASQPCVNGTCTDGMAAYTCTCALGWTGKNCNQNIDDCAQAPCLNGTCTDLVADYACNCLPGWSGKDCNVNNDNCASQPCVNGTCADAVDDYICACVLGWAGKNCDQNIDDCSPNPCSTGQCVDGIGTYSCACDPGWSGPDCSTNINECDALPCQNGSCVDGVNSYSCVCDTGWQGTHCDENINDCPTENPCQNGGACADGLNTYSCTCLPDFTGAMCQTKIDDCAPEPCQNNGVCTDGVNAFSCACPAGYSGTLCEQAVPCQVPLQVSPTTATVLTGAALNIQVSGGAGPYQFEFVNNSSNGMLNTALGTYLGGSNVPSADVIQVTDLTCQHSVQLTVQVVGLPLPSVPSTVSVPIEACLDLKVSQGSGQFQYQMVTQPTPLGAVDTNGVYTAGSSAGADLVEITDTASGGKVIVTVLITDNASLQLTANHYIVSKGSTQQLSVSGGSGQYTVSLQGTAASLDPSTWTLTGLQPGTGTITVTDDLIGCPGTPPTGLLSLKADVTVVEALNFNADKAAPAGATVHALSPGDLDGDGYADAIVSNNAAHWSGADSGVIHIFKGTADGLSTEPAQVIGGQVSFTLFGTSIAVGDLIGDSQLDLVVGAPEHNGGGSLRGQVVIYRGLVGGFFETAPTVQISSQTDFDRLGRSVAVCDVNGDGYSDLVTTAVEAEQQQQYTNQGAIHVYPGSVSGLASSSSQIVYGVAPVSNGSPLAPQSNHRMGRRMASGDYNGDGVCDILVTGGTSSNEWVYLYLGIKDQGLSLSPTRHFGPFVSQSGNLILRDVNNDGRDDAVIPVVGHSIEGMDRAGAVFVYEGDPQLQTPDLIANGSDVANWSIFGAYAYGNLGQAIATGDTNGDGWVDLLVNIPRGTGSNGVSQSGSIQVYRGQESGYFDKQIWQNIGGADPEERFGLSMAIVGDLNGDTMSEIVAMAPFNNDLGPSMGRAYTFQLLAAPTILYSGSWKYNVEGNDLGTSWLDATYDDSSWAEGSAPFGQDSDPNVVANGTVLPITGPGPPTVYFRKTITLEDGASWFTFTTHYFAGVAVWINGQLVHSENLSDTSFSANADGWITGSPSSYALSTSDSNPFVAGDNVIQVMVKRPGNWQPVGYFSMELTTSSTISPQVGFHVPLNTVTRAAGDNFGNTLAVVGDVNGDGQADLVVGAPDATLGGAESAGRAQLHLGTANGFSTTSSLTLGGTALHETWTNFGDVVEGVGDFDGDGTADITTLSRNLNQPSGYPSEIVVPAQCENQRDGVGGVFVVRGSQTGLPENNPAFVVYGPSPGMGVRTGLAGFDYDGDNIDDIALIGDNWDQPNGDNNLGGLALYRGRAANPGGNTQVICTTDALFYGAESGGGFGTAITSVGDLNQDGCDELLVSAPLVSTPSAAQSGSVTLIYGFGAACSSINPQVATLNSGTAQAFAGQMLASGVDANGDGLMELAVAAPNFTENNSQYGAVFVVGGAQLAGLQTTAMDSGVSQGAGAQLPTVENASAFQAAMIKGTFAGSTWMWDEQSRFGEAVHWLPSTTTQGVALVIGAARGSQSGTNGSGSVLVYEYSLTDTAPSWPFKLIAMFGGETYRPNGALGQSLETWTSEGKQWLIVGGPSGTPYGQSQRIDDGSVYVVPLTP